MYADWRGLRQSPRRMSPPGGRHFTTNQRGGRLLCRPSVPPNRKAYFRLDAAVRSTDSFAMPVAPHQLEPTPPGLIEVMLPDPEPSKVLVKAKQSPFDRSLSE